MADSNFGNVWEILRKYDFLEDNIIENEYLCILCKKLMINAQSAPCGCRYCLECISNYLDGQTKICPGRTVDCQDLSIGNNISIDYPTNSFISKIIVKCPEKSCKFEDELRKIGEHIINGKYQIIKCPYFNIGCEKSDVSHDSIRNHMKSDKYCHIKLLMDIIDNIHNEMNDFKTGINKLTLEKGNLFNEIEVIKEDMPKKYVSLNERIESQINQVNLILEDIAIINQNVANITRNINWKLNTITTNQEKLNYGDFIWKIYDFNIRLENARMNFNTQIISESFYSNRNGYKLCLRLYPNGFGNFNGRSLSVFYNLMKGEFDDILIWPFKCDVTLSIINQQTLLPEETHTVRYEEFPNNENFKKPTREKNEKGFGTYRLIDLNRLLNSAEVLKNGQIFIKCSFNFV